MGNHLLQKLLARVYPVLKRSDPCDVREILIFQLLPHLVHIVIFVLLPGRNCEMLLRELLFVKFIVWLNLLALSLEDVF